MVRMPISAGVLSRAQAERHAERGRAGAGAPGAGASAGVASLTGGRMTPAECRAGRGRVQAATCVSTAVSAMSGQIQQHHDRVLLVLRVVVRANADGPEAETPVEPQRGRVRAPNLERDEAALARAADLDDVREQAGRVARRAVASGWVARFSRCTSSATSQ